jgi:DNA-binding beta-propeller fold protein YncE
MFMPTQVTDSRIDRIAQIVRSEILRHNRGTRLPWKVSVRPRDCLLKHFRVDSFALESRGNRIYVNVPRTKQVAVVDRSARKVVASFGTGLTLENYPMALDEADSRIFIGCRLPARLLALDTASGKSVASLGTVGTTDDLFYDAARHRIYVLGGDGYVVTYSQSDANTYSEISRIATGPGGRTGLFIPELSQLLVATPRNDSEDAAVQVYQVQ